MTKDYIRNYLTYSLPGHLTEDEWYTVLTKIENLLAEEREEVKRKIAGMKVKEEIDTDASILDEDFIGGKQRGYNQAISHVLEILETKD